jgi:hypothetical protein
MKCSAIRVSGASSPHAGHAEKAGALTATARVETVGVTGPNPRLAVILRPRSFAGALWRVLRIFKGLAITLYFTAPEIARVLGEPGRVFAFFAVRLRTIPIPVMVPAMIPTMN